MSPFHLLFVRITIAGFLAAGIFYTVFWRPEATSYTHISGALSHLKDGFSKPSPGGTAHESAQRLMSLSHTTPNFNPNAHRLKDADEFQEHFAAVLQLPNVTMAEAKAACTWTPADHINLQFGESENEEGWVNASWTVRERKDWELEEPRAIWQNHVKEGFMRWEDYKDRFSGRGIIIVGGNGRTIPRIKVILKALKHLGSKIPVELHYWGDETTPEIQKELLDLWPRMYFNDLSAESNVIHTKFVSLFINYHLKTAAVLNSRFAEPMLLDSDNIPTIKPEDLYESQTYKEYGTVFWPDMARTRPNNPVWAITNTKCKMDEWEQESGQMLVDKRRFFYHLQLAAWLNNVHGQYWNNIILGDKDMFRFSWEALKTPYGTPTNWLTSVGTYSELANGGHFYCGHTFAQHHPDKQQIAFLHGGTLKTVSRQVLEWSRKERNGIFQAYKRFKYDHDKTASPTFNGVPDHGVYVPEAYKPLDRATMCTDFEEIEARPFEEIMPGFEQLFDSYGGYWMLDEQKGMPL